MTTHRLAANVQLTVEDPAASDFDMQVTFTARDVIDATARAQIMLAALHAYTGDCRIVVAQVAPVGFDDGQWPIVDCPVCTAMLTGSYPTPGDGEYPRPA